MQSDFTSDAIRPPCILYTFKLPCKHIDVPSRSVFESFYSQRSLPLTDSHKTIVVTGVGVVSPYGVGLDCLQAGMLSGKCCLEPAKDAVYPGFEGTIAQ